MLYCSYHPKNAGVVQCNQCARQLCSACDHRIRGFPFCQDCIVAGVEMLRQESQSSPISYRSSSPFIATLLSFVPGLGAAYNGQTAKAIVHFAIFASFFQMAVLTQGVTFLYSGRSGHLAFRGCRCVSHGPTHSRWTLARYRRGCDYSSLVRQSIRLGNNAGYYRHSLPAPHTARSSVSGKAIPTGGSGGAGCLHAFRLCSPARIQ